MGSGQDNLGDLFTHRFKGKKKTARVSLELPKTEQIAAVLRTTGG